MSKSGTAFSEPSWRHYLNSRMAELATEKSRSITEPLAQWALKHIRLDSRPFSFDGHEYLRTLYDETAQHIVLMKGAQVGGTTWAMLRTIHACINGMSGMYLFPTRTDVLDFSKSRVKPLLDENPSISRQMTDTDTAGLKKIGPGYLYLRGMQSDVGLKSVPADMLVLDELDEAEPQAKAMALERLAHSRFKRIIELSNPSFPDFGIDEAFLRSDQRFWTVKCPSCSHWVCLDREFPERMNQEIRIILPRADGSFYRACPKCAGELDMAAGEWVATYPSRPIHGYRISQLISSFVNPGDILHEYKNTRFPGHFFNLKLGRAWADLERRLDMASTLSLCTDRPMLEKSEAGGLSMGVDTGNLLHVVILQRDPDDYKKQRVVFLAACREWSELDDLMKRFKIARCVVDAMPEIHLARQFAERHSGHAYVCFFSEDQKGSARWDHHERKVDVNRTEALDASRAAVREKLVSLPRRDPQVETFARHMTCDAKKLEVNDETGAKRYKYIKTGENHFSFAFTYAWMAAHNVGGVMALMYMRQAQARREASKKAAS